MVTQRRRLRRTLPKPPLAGTISEAFTSTQYDSTIMPPSPIIMQPIPTIEITPSPTDESTGFLPQPVIASLGITPLTTTRAQNDGGCSHLTLTRLYTHEHVCSVCLQFGAFGWLYRCTQDRELLIENDIESGIDVERVDDLYKTLPTSEVPRKWSPEARSNPLSLLDEIAEEQLKTYTPAQLSILLQQRAQVHKAIQAQLQARSPPASTLLTKLRILDPSSVSPPLPFLSTSTKPWLPETECQFRICPRCRPSCRDKSFLSLNAIANDEIPATASVGFGFHLKGARPVVNVEMLREIGLRRDPWEKAREKRRTLRLKRREGFDSLVGGQQGSVCDSSVDQSGHTKRPSPLRIFDTGAAAKKEPDTNPMNTLVERLDTQKIKVADVNQNIDEQSSNDEYHPLNIQQPPVISNSRQPFATLIAPENLEIDFELTHSPVRTKQTHSSVNNNDLISIVPGAPTKNNESNSPNELDALRDLEQISSLHIKARECDEDSTKVDIKPVDVNGDGAGVFEESVENEVGDVELVNGYV